MPTLFREKVEVDFSSSKDSLEQCFNIVLFHFGPTRVKGVRRLAPEGLKSDPSARLDKRGVR